MKKGDIIARETILPIGQRVLGNCDSEETAKRYMEGEFLQEFGVLPGYELKPDDLNPSRLSVILTSPVTRKEEAKVNWIIEGDIAIQYKDGSCRIFAEAEEPDWVVIQEGIPTYQSSVANLSDDDLRKAIDDLRAQRSFTNVPKAKVSTPRATVDKSDPMAVALAALPEEKRVALMKKLGLVD